ncbi:DNA-3-methyladenine glycosylase I [Bradyrhizobium prioriisuperbiae]|uniref:DNA-3-methyladenine glycosylase I n=1 Tax=Bradyrhizobium prioriisuperbiae TaxID=2854389 RepID=UPI0028F07C6C|nr:DNA-3-methyladenine glycosylase I [Bradyrhizobium prioritasuperba]
MRPFGEITELAAERAGGIDRLEDSLLKSRASSPTEIAAIPDDRILSEMSRRVFHAGFSWKVVDAKWEAFEVGFFGFDPNACAAMSEETFDALLKNKAIIRNGAKVRSVALNARFVLDLAATHGSASRAFADWPDTDYLGLLNLLKKRASRLGGQAAMRFLRSIGKSSFITTGGGVAALIREGVLDKAPSGVRDLQAIQDAFGDWQSESGRDFTAISRILAMSVAGADAGEPGPSSVYITPSLTQRQRETPGLGGRQDAGAQADSTLAPQAGG